MHGWVVDPEELPLERLVLLLEQLSADHPRATKARIAAMLGMHPSMVSKLESGSRSAPSAKTIGRVVQALGIDARFFYEDADLAPAPHYRDYLRTRRQHGDPPEWQDFKRNWRPFERLSTDERAALKGLITSSHDVLHWTEWVIPAEWIMSHRR